MDPHSQFMDPNDFRDMQDDTAAGFNGLGIEVSNEKRPAYGSHSDGGTPPRKAGILSGDQILRNQWHVDGQNGSSGRDQCSARARRRKSQA
jgi:carboxyl-terminal processing protease